MQTTEMKLLLKNSKSGFKYLTQDVILLKKTEKYVNLLVATSLWNVDDCHDIYVFFYQLQRCGPREKVNMSQRLEKG